MQLMTLNEAAEYASISEPLLRTLCYEGKVPHFRIGMGGSKKSLYRFSKLSLDAWMRRIKNSPDLLDTVKRAKP